MVCSATRVMSIVLRLLLLMMAWTPALLTLNALHPAAAGETRNVALPDASPGPAPHAPPSVIQPGKADFGAEAASNAARLVAHNVMTTGDNAGLPFVIIDKIQAKVFVFDSSGQLRGATLALLGETPGDDSVPGIGSRKLSTIRPSERTTPAGRFVAILGRDFEQDILWIDYDSALSLHRVIIGAPGDHRLQRLATISPLDNRISYGCINVPATFYDDVVVRTFADTRGIVYILPEFKKIEDVFPTTQAAADPVGGNAVPSVPMRDNGA